MNANGSKIEIFKPFHEAFELMKKVLFQPFDFKKWLVIGFAAWLANIGGGGGGAGGFNYPNKRREGAQKLNETIGQIPQPVLITVICILVCLVLLLIVLFAWLRARGRFVFIDCIVKNRGAIVEPWREFRKEGTSSFLFSLVAGLVILAFAALLSTPLIILAIRGRYYLALHRDRLDVYIIGIIAAWVFSVLLVLFAWALIASFMAPVMYRRRCRAYEAFRDVLSLIAMHPGEFLLYALFLIALDIAIVIVSCAAMCLTCCIAALPYIGTVILLPIFALLRSFSLCFLRQFGPEYDVWATFMPPEFLPVLMPLPSPSGSEAA
jgi:hypothetical protein